MARIVVAFNLDGDFDNGVLTEDVILFLQDSAESWAVSVNEIDVREIHND